MPEKFMGQIRRNINMRRYASPEIRYIHKWRLDHNGCWIWEDAPAHSGYGRLGVNGQMISAHRFSWEFHFGEIPNGLCVCHKCDVRACINPAHLFLGTQRQNIEDMLSKNRNRRGENSGQSILTEKQALEIYHRAMAGEGQKALGEEYGCSQKTVSRIKNGQRWIYLNRS